MTTSRATEPVAAHHDVYEHVHPNFRSVLLASDETRLAFLDEPRWIGYQHAQLVLDTLHCLMDMPWHPQMHNLLVVGSPNNGKTTLMKRFRQLCGEPYVDADANAVKPIVLTQAPPSADEKGLYISILECFWAPFRPTASAVELRSRAVQMLRMCKVRMLIIDDFHSLLTGPATKQREVLNAITFLRNELRRPIVGVCTRDAVVALHSEPQHANQFYFLPVPLWSLDSDFQKLLAGIERVLPLRMPSHLSAPQTATIIHAISGGNIGNAYQLVNKCAKKAIMNGQEQITEDLLRSIGSIKPTKGGRELRL